MGKRRRKPEITRDIAMQARPCRLPVEDCETDKKGDLRVTLDYERPRWQRTIGAPAKCRRTYVLDSLGRELYELLDDRKTVGEIVKGFAGKHKVSVAEAEYSVTTYLKTLMSKGLVMMAVDEKGL